MGVFVDGNGVWVGVSVAVRIGVKVEVITGERDGNWPDTKPETKVCISEGNSPIILGPYFGNVRRRPTRMMLTINRAKGLVMIAAISWITFFTNSDFDSLSKRCGSTIAWLRDHTKKTRPNENIIAATGAKIDTTAVADMGGSVMATKIRL